MNFVRKNIFYFIVVKSRDEVINKIKEECNLLYILYIFYFPFKITLF